MVPQLNKAYVTYMDSLPNISLDPWAFTGGGDTLESDMDIASAPEYSQARAAAINAVIRDITGAIQVETQACEGILFAVNALKKTQKCIKTLLEYYDSFIVVQKQVEHAIAAVTFERQHCSGYF